MGTTVPSTDREAAISAAYAELCSRARESQLLGGASSLLHWDQEVLMPPGGLEYRSRQIALLARMHHEMTTDPKVGDLLGECEADAELMADPHSDAAVNVRELRRTYNRATKVPSSLVEEEARLASVGQHHWAEARRDKDFPWFRPFLEQIIALMRRKAECLGWPDGGEPWDALADDYEPGCTASQVEVVFVPLRERLQALLDDLMGSGSPPDDAFIRTKIPVERQRAFVRFVAERIGFDFSRGRLDVSTHPFCSGTHCNDVRLTTRFHEDNVLDALGSTTHEAGHGMYEQGLPVQHIGVPRGDAVSLGIHESQSRMWENQVCRSRAFWEWCQPLLTKHLGDAVAPFDLDVVYGAANLVQPDFIRVEADEATYNMHVMVRFEIERALLRGELEAADVPGVWNAKYEDYLGVKVPDDAQGCLQDIHWSMCAMGYFPTYTLGNLYAAQFFEKASADIPDMQDQFRRGEFGALLGWLNTNIHSQGRRYRAAELCEHVTGKPLSADPLMRHLESKLRPLYGV
jgi:carboxypeptidase Taq